MVEVLHISTWYPHPAKPHFGRFIREHIAAVSSQDGYNHTAWVVLHLPSQDWLTFKHRSETVGHATVQILEVHSRLHKLFQKIPAFTTFFLRQLAKRHTAYSPNLIHAHVVSPAGVAAQNLAINWAVPLVVTEHWSGIERLAAQTYFGPQALAVYKSAYVTAVSEPLAHRIKALVPSARVTVVPNVVSDAFQLADTASPPYYLMVMNLVAGKRADWVIEALKELPENWPSGARLCIVGDGPDRAHLEAEVRLNNLPVEFLGQLPHAEIAALMNHASGFWHATETETFGLVVAEALQAGVPVLASDIPALQALVTAHDGMLVQHGAAAWRDSVTSFLGNEYDRQAIAARNAGKFSSSAVATAFRNIYAQALAARP